jgi:hypothetical protein
MALGRRSTSVFEMDPRAANSALRLRSRDLQKLVAQGSIHEAE